MIFDPISIKALRNILSDSGAFKRLAEQFIDEAVSEMDALDDFRDYFAGSVKAITIVNSDAIDRVVKSPIECIFLRSLLLSFLKNDGLGLLLHPTFKDAASEVADFRSVLASFWEFKAWFKEHKPNEDVAIFLDGEMNCGKMDAEERNYYNDLLFKYYSVPLDRSYHMSLQPRFPNVIANGKVIRPDIYFWIPARPDINVVVECDGFAFHSDKETFTRDRQRDRALKAKGYDVFRFSGSEIFNDPVNSAHELATYLWERNR